MDTINDDFASSVIQRRASSALHTKPKCAEALRMGVSDYDFSRWFSISLTVFHAREFEVWKQTSQFAVVSSLLELPVWFTGVPLRSIRMSTLTVGRVEQVP